MKRLIIFFSCLCLVMTAAADSQTERINSIKKDTAYIYADITMPTVSEAMSAAYGQLQREVHDWTLKTGEVRPLNISPADINSLADTIITPRLDQYRFFAYVKKDYLRQLFHGQAVQKVPKPVAPVDSPEALVGDSVRNFLKEIYKRPQCDALERIKQAENFFELDNMMEPLKAKGEIVDYGKYATMVQPEECYLIVYDQAGNICAVLGKGKDKRKNLKTGQMELISSYRGCGAIWFILKQ